MRGHTGVACGVQNVTGALGKSDHDGGGDQRQHRMNFSQNEAARMWSLSHTHFFMLI
jgi:hypothetical protein